MDSIELDSAPAERRPRIWTVLGFLIGCALLLSWLGAYAMANALVSADLIRQWPADEDPRGGWMIWSFMTMLGIMGLFGAACKLASGRQLRRIDRMAEEE